MISTLKCSGFRTVAWGGGWRWRSDESSWLFLVLIDCGGGGLPGATENYIVKQ